MPPTHRLDQGPFYTVINRTCRALETIVDGRTFVLTPGRNGNIPSAALPYLFRQHPRLGTFGKAEDGEYLIAVDGITPPEHARMIEPGKEALGIERVDRVAFPHEGVTEFQRILTATGPAEKAPTFLDAVEKPGAIQLWGRD